MDDTPQHHAWVNPEKSRYYRVHLDRDLFGDWTLRKVWGGIDSSGGRMHNTGVPSYDEGVEQIREIAKRRCQRGYECVSRSPLHQSGSQSSDQTLASGPNPLSANLDNGPAHSLSTEPVSAVEAIPADEEPPAATTPVECCVEEYEQYLREERALAAATIVNYLPFIRELLTHRFGDTEVRLGEL